MDTVTQIALGAAVGEATLGRRVGNRAILWGAVCGTLPDLDVFVPLGDAVRDFTYHRSASHSLFMLAALTPLVVWLILKLHPQTVDLRRRWYMLVYLAFVTHVLLDSFTVYGTQIFWPIVMTPVALSTIFIIDPLYTLPLLVGVIAALVMSRDTTRGHRWNQIGLVLSSLYLTWTLAAKLLVEDVANTTLNRQGIDQVRVLTTPAPFNSLLWRVLAVDSDSYYEGFYSLLDPQEEIRLVRHRRRTELLEGLSESWPVQRLAWFTKGFYAAGVTDGAVSVTDLRMGATPSYVFRFKVGAIGNPHARPAPVERLPAQRDVSILRWVWRRIWDPDA